MSISLHAEWHDIGAWNRFVEAHRQGRFCHLFGYGDVLKCYGYEPVRLGFVRSDKLMAVLPGTRTKSVFFGRKIVCQPFSEYGGILVDPSAGGEDLDEIYQLLRGYLGKANAKFKILELHGDHGIPQHLKKEHFTKHFIRENPHHVALLSLDRPADQLWKDVIQYSVRKGVNKAQNNGVHVVEECSQEIVRNRFFPLYLSSMKRLGVPPHSLEYYLRCQELMQERMKIFWAVKEGNYVAGLLGFITGRSVHIVNIVSDRNAWGFSPNDLIHWEFIRWSAESGINVFDFGSVRYDGQRTYKKKWGTTFEEHAHYFLRADAVTTSSSTFNSSSETMATFSRIWSNYVPASVARRIGPHIRKQLVR